MHDLLDQVAKALHRLTFQRDRQYRFAGAQKPSSVLIPKKPETVLSLRKTILFSGMPCLVKGIFLVGKGKGGGVNLGSCIGR